MTVTELKSEIESLNSSGKIDNQTVEVVYNDKKYFVEDIKADSEAFCISVTRNFFKQYPLKELTKMLDQADTKLPQGKCMIAVTEEGGEPVEINKLFCSDWCLELTVAKEA